MKLTRRSLTALAAAACALGFTSLAQAADTIKVVSVQPPHLECGAEI